ncbi:MAG: hypothetical protein K2H16_01625 [Prevotella sp.]|nr:hypothetical protein [Prevotella sp.]
MKKTFKIIGGILLALIMIGNIVKLVAKHSYENSIEAQIKRTNRDCPIPVANGIGQVSSITLENHFLTYRIDYRQGHANINAFKENPDATRAMFYLSFVCLQAQGSYVEKMMGDLVSKGIGLKVVVSDGTGEQFTSVMTPEYITNMKREVSLNPSEALHDALKLKLDVETTGLPTQIDDGMVMTGMQLEGDNIVVSVKMSEEMYDLDILEESSTELAMSLLNEANAGDPELGALFDLCKVSHSGLIYRAIGSKTNKHVDMGLSSEQIRKGRKTQNQVNIN